MTKVFSKAPLIYSVTSNEVKMFKHLDKMTALQQGKISPVMIHIAPTNVCNQNCVHCCFSERERTISLDLKLLKSALDQSYNLGIGAVEWTGGGEPTLYPCINEATEYVAEKKMKLGMNTNALSIEKIKPENWSKFQWVRVALNVFDGGDEAKIKRFEENVKYLKDKTRITACYIVSKEIGCKNIGRVVEFTNKYEILSRLAPDCIQTKEGIKDQIDEIKEELKKYGDHKYIYLSDFNVYLFDREDNVCLMHMWKPFLYTDGYVYACPSSELAIENNRTMQPKFRVCHASEIEKYYKNNFEIFHHPCSYCKYAKQNQILYSLLKEVDDKEFS
ncbi:MAG: radical SAM protein [Candidatus Nealsonbacteria bacterium]|nr:radical SAM protein [Candidatus Nealsonbacteria bacterium]